MKCKKLRLFRYLRLKLRFPRDTESIAKSMQNIRMAANLTGPNLWVLVAAIFIASLGLNTNSTAVIIGAMLISPLMGPIIGFGLGLGTDDISLVKRSIRNFILMVFMSVATSTLFFLLSPMKEAGSELLGRTSPTVYDVLIAFFGGLAGIIAGSSSLRSSNVIPGVAIATALMPPLCTMGYGFSVLSWKYIAGAFYLFAINSVFISLATYFVVTLLKYPSARDPNPAKRKRVHFLITLLVLLMLLPSIYLTYHIVRKYFYKGRVELFVKNEISNSDHIVVNSKFEYRPGNSLLELVVVGDKLDSIQLAGLQTRMNAYGLDNCRLAIYQGSDNQKDVLNVFESLNTDLQVQNLSIREIYFKMDSLKRGLNGSLVPDSLQVQIAGALYQSDSLLDRLKLERGYAFNPGKNKRDTLWKVYASFRGPISVERQSVILGWLKERLRSPYVELVFQEAD